MLERAGLHVNGADDTFVYLEDPGCVLRNFQDFIENAWIVLAFITGGLVMMWGITMIRGSKNDIKNSFKTLAVIFGILTATGPILNVIYGGDLFAMGCGEIRVNMDQVNSMLSARAGTSADASNYEDISIYDSGAIQIPDSELPVAPDISVLADTDIQDPDAPNAE
ncbi:MAG: hypothetical protein J6T57_00385 [Alphaproteobacteria bacterium]|nr:hypothetical protein [Alphaproteobacteria bacterium]